MAEPVDYFLQGANLGMRAAQFGTENEQFRTNLAERARQFNQNFSLEQRATNAAIARDEAAKRLTDFNLRQEEEEYNKTTNEMADLQEYLTEVRKAQANNVLNLPLPPSTLTGVRQEQAYAYREEADKARQLNADYRIAVKERDDLQDLITNYGLRSDFLQYANDFEASKMAGSNALFPVPQNSVGGGLPPLYTPQDELREAFMRRSISRAEAIASEFGVNPMLVLDNSILSNFVDRKGDLDKNRFRAYVSTRPDAAKTISSRTTSSTGAVQETIKDREPSNSESILRAALSAAKDDTTGELNVDLVNSIIESARSGEPINYNSAAGGATGFGSDSDLNNWRNSR